MRILKAIMVVLFFMGFFAVYGNGESLVSIYFKSDASVNSREYFLKDIADISSPGLMQRELENFSMGFSPAIGEVKVVSGESLALKLKSIPWLPLTADITFPDSVFIKRVSQEVPEETLMNIFRDYIQQRVNDKEFEINDFKVRGLNPYPSGEMVVSLRSPGVGKVKGRVSIQIDVTVDGVSQGKVSASGLVDIYDRVVCSTKSLSRGEILKAGDFCLKRLNISKITDDYLSSMDNLQGLRLKQNLGFGNYLRSTILEKAPLVERGDNVTLVALKGNMRIVALGIADQEGGLGDQILVKNITTGRVVSGRISGPKTVDVFF